MSSHPLVINSPIDPIALESSTGNVAIRNANGLQVPHVPSQVTPRPSHSLVVPSGGVAYPVSASRRGRWYSAGRNLKPRQACS